MFGIFSIVPALQAQRNQGVPWWVWLLLLICVIALLIYWLRRPAARSPASSSEKKPPAAEIKAPEPLPAAKAPPLEEAAAAAPPAEGAGLRAAETVAEEAGRAIEMPVGEALAVPRPGATAEPATARDLGAGEVLSAEMRAHELLPAAEAPPLEEAAVAVPTPETVVEGAGRAIEAPIAEALAVGEIPAAAVTAPVAGVPDVAAAAQAGAASVEVSTVAAGVAAGVGVRAAESAAAERVDDLTRIEGIGPKIAGLLRANGIGTFQQLAATDVPSLRKMLADAKLANLADPETWPEQAALAAAGKGDELQSLQEQLIGGRRVQANDLTLIEGIGPKIASLLQQAGIKTFKQLAAADVSRLREILAAAKLRNLADPETWPEQAGLAAAGKWEELRVLTARLKGGRRV